MRIVHLTASTFFGGPERQMLGLAAALPAGHDSRFLSFPEGGRCAAFLGAARAAGFAAGPLENDGNRPLAAVRELTARLRDAECDVLVCHGYKSNIIGRPAARRSGAKLVSVSRGWTAETLKVRLYEWLDRRHLRHMDRVVCVSDGQAAKVRRRCGVSESKLRVIRNAARLDAFAEPDPARRGELRGLLPGVPDDARWVIAAGRLSPEKGYQVLVEAAPKILAAGPSIRIAVFGDGALRESLRGRLRELGVADRVALAGFRRDLDGLLPWGHVMALPSFTEGLPNVLLEASAAGLPCVATAVGGSPEVVRDGVTGRLVAPGDADALAAAVTDVLADESRRAAMGEAARGFMRERFTFAAQAEAYRELFSELQGAA